MQMDLPHTIIMYTADSQTRVLESRGSAHLFMFRPWVKSTQLAVFQRDCRLAQVDLLGF